MKRLLLLLVAGAVLTCYGCTSNSELVTNDFENENHLIDNELNENDLTENDLTENNLIENNEKEETQKENHIPLFDASKHNDIPVPQVVDAESLVKDELFDGSYQYRYIVKIPKIVSEKPGARAFNERIYSEYADFLDIEANRSQGLLHQITYKTSSYDGIIVIYTGEDYGLYQSEGVHTTSLYYYDSINDKELTKEEYLSHFGIDASRLERLSGWCIGDREIHSLKYGKEITDSENMVLADTLPDEGLYFSYYKNPTPPVGYIVTENTVFVHFNVSGYVTHRGVVEIDVATGLPQKPNFFIKSAPTGVYEENDDGLFVVYQDGKITEVLVGKNIPLIDVTISNYSIDILSMLSYRGFTFDSIVEMNGEVIDSGGSGGLYGDDMVIDSYYYPRAEYTDELVIRITNQTAE